MISNKVIFDELEGLNNFN